MDECPGITDVGVIAVARGASSLLELDLRGNSAITDTAAHAILASCTRLERLDMRGCCIGDHVAAKLKAAVCECK